MSPQPVAIKILGVWKDCLRRSGDEGQ